MFRFYTVDNKRKYLYDQYHMANRTSLVFFTLVFTVNHAENLNFYFSLHENHAINSSFIKSVYTQDVLSCGRACAAELNCNTANYLNAENKCDLSEERIENNSRQEPVAAILKGCLLIEKVRINLYLSELAFVIKSRLISDKLPFVYNSVLPSYLFL